TGDVRRKDALDARGVDALDAGVGPQDSRVVDERGDRPELTIAALEQSHDVALARHVGLNRGRRATTRHDAGDDAFGRITLFAKVDGDRIAARGGERGRGRADAATGAGDEQNRGWHDGSGRVQREHRV